MTWTTDPTMPVRADGPAWTDDAATPVRAYGPGWFALTERVAEFTATGALSVDVVGVIYPQCVAEFSAEGTLAVTIAPIKSVAAAFSAVGGLSTTIAQRKVIVVNLSASTDGLEATCDGDGLFCSISGGGGEIHDGLVCTIKGGAYDGLRASLVPIVDGLTAQLEKV